MKQSRVLLLEDDARTALLVEMALEGLPIELVHCASVPEIEQQLGKAGKAPVSLFISDLMLPGESGLSLLGRLSEVPGYSPSMRTLAFSAGLTAETREKLKELGVWRVISKPASVAALRACAEEAILEAAGHSMPDLSARHTGQPASAAASLAHIKEYFGGDLDLFAHFERACRTQFPLDVAEGDSAFDGRDLGGLERLAHSLKGVMGTLGASDAAALANQLEAACRDADTEAALALWPRLRQHLHLPP